MREESERVPSYRKERQCKNPEEYRDFGRRVRRVRRCGATWRRRGYQGGIVMVSDDAAPPVDRPNLSKDYLAGKAPEDWIPLRST